jgi:molybdenum cofactor biosynthesis protein MoaF
MGDIERADAVRGKTIRLKWSEGPTKGKTYEHVFHGDGTVEWRDSGAGNAPAGGSSPKAPPAKERAQYGATKVADQIYAVSYLAPSGFTLTVVLNFRDRTMVGFASGAKDWFPVRGTFEVAQ